MQFALLGWPEDGPTLRLDYRRFSYAGKFVMSTTGKAVVRDPGSGSGTVEGGTGAADADGTNSGSAGADAEEPAVVDPAVFEEDVLAAAAFNEDRTDPGVLWIRYIDVADTRRGERLGTRLALFVRERAKERGYRRLRIAVNNPFSYEALYKAGFGYTGRQTGLAELVLEYPAERDRPTYQCGLDVFRERDLDPAEHDFLDRKEGMDAPPVLDAPMDGDVDGVDVGGERDSDADSDSDRESGEA
ncbi:GNAT family N-acetyltransferase [Halobium salinum]|uniref:GNAT family N-acetyltransferase n=1 Tax=Halobium salinum TaxID=1364940 RepID=A0ABD5PE57_9EURY|nr:GNAT family N-acetyltransferase [Halobium salinum]